MQFGLPTLGEGAIKKGTKRRRQHEKHFECEADFDPYVIPSFMSSVDQLIGSNEFERQAGTFHVSVDNSTLASLINGHAQLWGAHYRPILSRAISAIIKILGIGWTPHPIAADPISWVPREQNFVADRLSTFTMKRKSSWHQKFEFLSDLRSWCVECYSDGGKRGNVGAGAWVILAVRETEFQILEAGGVFLDDPTATAFATEMIAPDAALSRLGVVLQDFGFGCSSENLT